MLALCSGTTFGTDVPSGDAGGATDTPQLRTDSVSQGTVYLSWIAGFDEEDEPAFASVRVRYADSLTAKLIARQHWDVLPLPPAPQQASSANRVEITGLSLHHTYSFFLEPLDRHGRNLSFSNTVQAHIADYEIPFADTGLREAVRRALGPSRPKALHSRAIQLEKLCAIGYHISDLTGIERLTNLRVLILDSNLITDVSPLAELPILKRLDLRANRIVDIDPLSALTQLWSLDLSGNRIENLEGLSGLLNLEHLAAAHNRLADISPLADMRDLKVLRLEHNRIKNIEPLMRQNDILAPRCRLYLYDNLLTEAELEKHLPRLIERRVKVFYYGRTEM